MLAHLLILVIDKLKSLLQLGLVIHPFLNLTFTLHLVLVDLTLQHASVLLTDISLYLFLFINHDVRHHTSAVI